MTIYELIPYLIIAILLALIWQPFTCKFPMILVYLIPLILIASIIKADKRSVINYIILVLIIVSAIRNYTYTPKYDHIEHLDDDLEQLACSKYEGDCPIGKAFT